MTQDQFDVIEALYLRDQEDGSFRRALEHAYRAGIEAAAKCVENNEQTAGWVVEDAVERNYARQIRALAAPAAPKAPERGWPVKQMSREELAERFPEKKEEP